MATKKVIKTTLIADLVIKGEVNLLDFINVDRVLKALPLHEQKTIKYLMDNGAIRKDGFKLYKLENNG